MSEISGPLIMFSFALAVTVLAMIFDNRCEPFLAMMVGGCR